jgi:4-amino-4-deoxy-L-arabinose transferase-like glycosyltransferase
MKRIIYIFLLVSVCVNFIGNILAQQRIFTRPYNRAFFAKKYSESQYVIGSSSKGIGDDGLYAFAGQYYITGGDPTRVNFENPPLGKYLIGVSILLFNNENMIYIIFAICMLVGTYLLAYLLFHDHLIAVIAVFILTISRLFQMQYIPTDVDQLSITLLDLPLALFWLYGVLSFLLSKKYRGMYIISSLFFGLALVTKFFPALILFLPVFFIYLWKYRRRDIVIWLSSLILIPLIYVLSYSRFFN